MYACVCVFPTSLKMIPHYRVKLLTFCKQVSVERLRDMRIFVTFNCERIFRIKTVIGV